MKTVNKDLKNLPEKKITDSDGVKKLINEIHTYYENIIGHMPGNVYWLDTNCKGLGCNLNVLKTLKLNSVEQFVGIDFSNMAKKAQWEKGQGKKFLEDTQEVIRTGIAKYNVEEPAIPNNKGKCTYFLTSRVPLFNEDKEVIGVVGISTDITYQKKVEKDLIRAKAEIETLDEARKLFVANMSHDMRTLLSGIVGISELLPLAKNDKTQTDDLHNILKISSKKLLDMANEILDLSWQGKVRICLKEENISRLFYEMIKIFQPLFEEKKLPFLFDISTNLPSIVLCDATAVTRIVTNLLGNALKYTNKGYVKINIQCVNREDKSWIKIRVEDTGIGIPKKKLKVIFELFSRLHQNDSSHYEGFGIGLSVVKTLAESLNGLVEVSSQLNKGSVFTCWLPIMPKNANEK